MRPPPYPLVYIEWDDSYGCSSRWERIPSDFSAPRQIVCRSVGWLIHNGKKHKVVVPHLTEPEEDEWDGCGEMTIPVAVIIRLVRLIPPKRVRERS